MQEQSNNRCALWVLGVAPGSGREQQLMSYLGAGGYDCCLKKVEEVTDASLSEDKPLGIVLDISPFSQDGWGQLQLLKKNQATRNIPVLPVFLSETGKVAGVFPVAGFITLPLDIEYVMNRLAVYGLTEEAEIYDLQAMIVSRQGEAKLAKLLETIGFEPVNAYTAKEAVALVSIHPVYLAFVSLMLPDMSSFELREKFRLLPYTSNTPLFVLLKDEMKEGEKIAMSREIAHLVSKKQLSCEEFLKYLRCR